MRHITRRQLVQPPYFVFCTWLCCCIEQVKINKQNRNYMYFNTVALTFKEGQNTGFEEEIVEITHALIEGEIKGNLRYYLTISYEVVWTVCYIKGSDLYSGFVCHLVFRMGEIWNTYRTVLPTLSEKFALCSPMRLIINMKTDLRRRQEVDCISAGSCSMERGL